MEKLMSIGYSRNVVDLISSLLIKEAGQRPNMTSVMKHPWFKGSKGGEIKRVTNRVIDAKRKQAERKKLVEQMQLKA